MSRFMADLSACFFEAFAEDMERHRQKLIDEGIPVSAIRRMLGNMHYVKSQTSIRRGIRNGDEIVYLLNKLWLKYADKDIFVKGAFDELPKCFKTIKSFVKDINAGEDLVPVWKNIGTDEVPIWLTCRGTNLCENYHRVNKTLKLHRFGYDVGNPLYILSLFAYSHQYRFSRLGLDLIEFLFDPVLANDLVILQAELRDYITYPPILQGHQLLEDLPESDHLCSLSNISFELVVTIEG